jgi:hypothetical protein
MAHIDPDALHGAMSDLKTAITDNADTMTTNGVSPATLQTRLETIQADLGTKKGARDKKKTELTNSQTAFVSSASDNYTAFSDLIDAAASGVGKKTPEGKRILAIRVHLNATPARTTAPASAPAAASH